MKGKLLRFISIITVCAMAFCLVSCGSENEENRATQSIENAESLAGNTYTKRPTALKKKEAVFVTLSSDGSVREINVTDRLTADSSKVRVDDVSTLSEIKNIKGTETPVIDGSDIVWHMNSTDLYYSGKTEKSLPVEIGISYTLNGESEDADSIKGKSGTLKIDVTAKNKLFESFEYNGKIMNIYTPFLIVGGMVLQGTQSGVTVTNGTSAGDGKKEIAFGFMLPGLSESFNIDSEKINIPESFSVSYDSSSHEKPSLMFAMIPLSLAGGENIISSVLSDTEGLGDSLKDFSEIFSSLTGDTSIKNIISQSDNISKLSETALQTVKSFSSQIALIEVLSRYLTEENAKLLSDFSKDLSKVELSKYAKLLEDPSFKALINDMGTVSESFSLLLPFITSFAKDISTEEVQKSIESLPETAENLKKLSLQLQNNKELINVLTEFSKNGNFENITNAFESVEVLLKDGTIEALSKIAENSDEMIFRLEKILELGKKYSIFTEAPKDAETSVYFVFKTQ